MASSAALESDRGRERRGGGGGALPRAYRRRERRGGASKLTRLLAVTAVGEAAATVVACRSRAVPLALKALLAHTAWVTARCVEASAQTPWRPALGLPPRPSHVGSTDGVRWKGYFATLLHAAALRVAKTP